MSDPQKGPHRIEKEKLNYPARTKVKVWIPSTHTVRVYINNNDTTILTDTAYRSCSVLISGLFVREKKQIWNKINTALLSHMHCI